MMYWGTEVGLLSLLELFSIDTKRCFEALTGRLVPMKERLIKKHRVLRRSNSSPDTGSSKNHLHFTRNQTTNQQFYVTHTVFILIINTSTNKNI